MFTRDFFRKHQKLLLFVTRTRLLNWLFGFHKLPKELRGKGVRMITENSIHWLRDDGQVEGAFFTRPRFAEALELNLKRLAIPFLALVPKLAPFGLVMGTSTDFYAGTETNYSVFYSLNSGTWDDAWDSVGTSVSLSTGTTYYSNTHLNGAFKQTGRSIMRIDTSAIGSGSTISSATLSLVNDFYANTNSISLYISTTSLSTISAAADYTRSNWDMAADYGNSTFASWSAGAGTRVGTTITDLTTISKTGTTKYALLTSLDRSRTSPTGLNGLDVRDAAFAGTASDPYLTVVYSASAVAVNGNTLLLMGVG